MAYQPAILNTARLNNFRLNYQSAALKAIRDTRARITIAGELANPRIRYNTVTVRDVINDTPNTCAFTVDHDPPGFGDRVEVWINSNAPQLLFAGAVQTLDVSYEGGRPVLQVWHVSAVDDTERLNRLRPYGSWTNVSASTVAVTIVSQFAPGLTAKGVQNNLPPVSVNFDTSEGFDGCLKQLAKLIGGYFYVENLDVHLFQEEPAEAPDPVDPAHPPQNDPPNRLSTDASQLRTRVYGVGGGSVVLIISGPGDTSLPLEDAVWFVATGGAVIAPGTQRLTYTGVQAGGAGTLIGPGIGPSTAPTAQLAAGAGVDTGAHDYAVTYRTPSGESLLSPRTTITVGPVAAPTTPPAAGAAQAGAGVGAGWHHYAVSFVTASGETPPGPPVFAATDMVPAPDVAPVPAAPTAGGAMDAGTYQYALTYQLAGSGETTLGPASGAVVIGGAGGATIAPPTTVGPLNNYASPSNYSVAWAIGDSVAYAITYLTAAGGETTIGPVSNAVTIQDIRDFGWNGSPAPCAIYATNVTVPSDPTVTGKRMYVRRNGTWIGYLNLAPSWTGGMVDNVAGAGVPPATNTATGPTTKVTMTVPVRAGCTRNVYRYHASQGWRLLSALGASETSTADVFALANTASRPAPPATNGAVLGQIPLSAIPVGGPVVTARKIWGSAANTTALKLVATIADNVTTTYLVTTPDASLGVAAPTTNTATANQVALSNLAIGGATVTQRSIYRTKAGLSQLQLVATLANNTATTYVDAIADAALGANAPSADTSGILQPDGQVNAGATSIPVAGAVAFTPTGGWAIIGNGEQVIQYAGVSGNTLTGIPASGRGAIVAGVSFNSTITTAPALTGIPATGPGSIQYPILPRDPVNIWVQRDDTAAQAAYGIHEGPVLRDERRATPSLVALCDAELALYAAPIQTVTYTTRDTKSRSGKTVTVNFPTPPIAGTLVIQDVTISEIDIAPGLAPRFAVSASTVRFSLEDVLRRAAGAESTR